MYITMSPLYTRPGETEIGICSNPWSKTSFLFARGRDTNKESEKSLAEKLEDREWAKMVKLGPIFTEEN